MLVYCLAGACQGGTVLSGDGAEIEDDIDVNRWDGQDVDGLPDESTADACVPTGPEVCNDLDDDCDGRTDEQLWCEVVPFHDGWLWAFIWGSGPADVWVSGIQVRPDVRGILMHWDGARWTDAAPSGWITLGPIGGSDPDEAWLAAQIAVSVPSLPDTALLRWDGSTWSSPWWLDAHEGVASLFAAASNDSWAGGSYRAGLDIRPLVWRWDGSSWTLHDLPPESVGAAIVDVFAASPMDLWAVDGSSLGLVLHWNGRSWATMRPPLAARQRNTAVWAAGPDDVWVSGNQQILHWDGTSWVAWTESVPNYMEDVWGFASDDIWVVGGEESAGGAILHWNGADWGWVARDLLGSLRVVWGASPSEVWAAGEHGIIRRWRQ